MRFSIKDYLDYFELDANLYSIELYVTPISEKDFKAIADQFRYYCRKTGCSWLVILSSTEAKTAQRKSKRTGKRGRPVQSVHGKRVDSHIHTAVKGNKDKSAFTTCGLIKNALNKRYRKKVSKIVSKGKGLHAFNYIGYALRQADSRRSGGDFNFLDYIKSHNRYNEWK